MPPNASTSIVALSLFGRSPHRDAADQMLGQLLGAGIRRARAAAPWHVPMPTAFGVMRRSRIKARAFRLF